jgi:hypothetical protein
MESEMMYENGFAIAIKNDGKVLREVRREGGKAVYMPFDSEYDIFLKNKNDRRALVNVDIDGMEAAHGIVLGANDHIDLERFLIDGDLHSGNRFKFVRADNREVQDPTDPENGYIRVEFWMEKERPQIQYDPYRIWKGGYRGQEIQMKSCSERIGANLSYGSRTVACSADIGATVEGGHSDQEFRTTSFYGKEPYSTVLEIRILGGKVHTVNKTRRKRRNRADSQRCTECGRLEKKGANFCSNCGSEIGIAV